jgi:hypothetical protein
MFDPAAVEEFYDPSNKRHYFYNHKTGQSGWTREEAMDGPMTPNYSPTIPQVSPHSVSSASTRVAGADFDYADIAAASSGDDSLRHRHIDKGMATATYRAGSTTFHQHLQSTREQDQHSSHVRAQQGDNLNGALTKEHEDRIRWEEDSLDDLQHLRKELQELEQGLREKQAHDKRQQHQGRDLKHNDAHDSHIQTHRHRRMGSPSPNGYDNTYNGNWSDLDDADSDCGSELPLGWERHFSSKHQRYFFYNASLNQTEWAIPTVQRNPSNQQLGVGMHSGNGSLEPLPPQQQQQQMPEEEEEAGPCPVRLTVHVVRAMNLPKSDKTVITRRWVCQGVKAIRGAC